MNVQFSVFTWMINIYYDSAAGVCACDVAEAVSTSRRAVSFYFWFRLLHKLFLR